MKILDADFNSLGVYDGPGSIGGILDPHEFHLIPELGEIVWVGAGEDDDVWVQATVVKVKRSTWGKENSYKEGQEFVLWDAMIDDNTWRYEKPVSEGDL